jgi:uracil-DNA glycosylase
MSEHSSNLEGTSLQRVLREVRACRFCEAHLPLGVRLLIVGQAPGSKVHESGTPWSDASGDRLREWLQLESAQFYDAATVAIVPMGLCYPGRGPGGADLPPRPECAPRWHRRLLDELPQVRLTLLLGQYAQRFYLGSRRKVTLTQTVHAWDEYAPRFFPLPHPSWRSAIWMRRNPWFEAEILPALRAAVASLL